MAEKNDVKTCGTESKREKGNVGFKHGNGTNFSNETETKTSFGLKMNGVPRSLADDEEGAEKTCNKNSEKITPKQTVNCTNSKACDVKSSEMNSNGVPFGVMRNTESRVTVHQETNTKCKNRTSSDLTRTSENICSKTSEKPDTKESSRVGVTKTNNVPNSDESCEKTNTVGKTKDFDFSYDAKKRVCLPGSVGLVNPQNLCYINSVVQCLSSVIELRTYLLGKFVFMKLLCMILGTCMRR